MANPILEGYVMSNTGQAAVRQVERSRARRKHGDGEGSQSSGGSNLDRVLGGFAGVSGGATGFMRAGANQYDREVAAMEQFGPSNMITGPNAWSISDPPRILGGTDTVDRLMRPGMISENSAAGRSYSEMAKTDSEMLYEQSMDKLNQAQNIFNLLEIMQNEQLSPEAQQQLQWLQEDTARQLAEVDYALQQAVLRENAFNQLSAQGQARTESFLEQGRNIIREGAASGSAGISGATQGGMANIGRVFDQAAADAVSALPAELASQGDLTMVMGGAEHRERRAQNEAAAADAATELQSLVESNVRDNASFTQRVNEASARAAEASLNIMGIQDEKARLQAQMEMETGIRTEVYNLTQQRRDIERNRERMERSLKEEDAAAQSGLVDRFGLGIDPSPEGMWDTTFTDSMESWLDRRGADMGMMDKQMFQGGVIQYLGMPDKNSLEAVKLLEQMSAVSGIPATEIARQISSSSSNADRVYKDLSNGDFSNARPGSAAFGSLIYQTALEMGVNPDQAAAWGNSAALHEIVRTMSDGKPGSERGGNLRGLGGVPEDIYENYGYSWEEVKGDPRKEMEVFLAYLLATGGNPSDLANTMLRDNGVDFSAMRRNEDRRKYGSQ